MFKYVLKKALILLLIYIAVMLGIFALQFKSESAISISIGPLKLSLTQTQDSSGAETALKNQFSAVYGPVGISAAETQPLTRVSADGTRAPLVLQRFRQTEQTCTLFFSDGVSLEFTVRDMPAALTAPQPEPDEPAEQARAETDGAAADGDTAPQEAAPDTRPPQETFSLTVTIPETVQSVSIPYTPAAGFSVSAEPPLTLFSSPQAQFAYAGPELAVQTITFSSNETALYLARYVPPEPEPEPDPVSELEPLPEPEPELSGWEQMHTLPLASAAVYRQRINQLEQAITQAVTSRTAALTDEQTIITVMALMTRQGRQTQAYALMPLGFSENSARTFRSAPFFGSIRELDHTLAEADAAMAAAIRTAAANNSLDIFTSAELVPYLLRQPQSSAIVTQVLSIPSRQTDFSPTLVQAAGVLSVWCELSEADSPLAARLNACLEPALAVISGACAVIDSRVSLSYGAADVSLSDAARVAGALIKYGTLSAQSDITLNGYAVINSYLTSIAQLGFAQCVELYRILVTDNPYMPRFQIINPGSQNPMWTWSCAAEMTYSRAASGDITITVDYLPTGSHYMAIKNVEPFYRIEMYNLNYRSDPRFEIYDASGYVYNSQTRTLYLKVRHHAQREIIRLIYSRDTPIPPDSRSTYP